MYQMAELAGGKNERPNVPCIECDSGIRSQMRALCREGTYVPSENPDAGSQIELLIDVTKTLQQPAAKEPGAAGNKYPLGTCFLPQRRSVLQNQPHHSI